MNDDILTERSLIILDRLQSLRHMDAPTHGGRVLSYVYDSGLAELDELAARAIRIMQPVNGLDPTTFPSVAAMERDIVEFSRRMLHGDDPEIVGTVTSGGTESCLLAVKTARDLWRAAGGTGVPRLLAPVTVHAAFHKAADYFGLDLDLVSVGQDGRVDPAHLVARFGPDVALVVVSAPAYPHASFDPVAPVAAAAREAGISCHVDACIGGWVLPWWGDDVPEWDFSVAGVTSISADLHKYGYAPKGVSVLLHRGRDRQRAQFFAATRWPGYPVVNSTMLGSKSAASLAAAWAIIQRLGVEGLASLTAQSRRATDALRGIIDSVDGLRVVGDPVGPLFAVASDDSVPSARRVDPHHWADRVRARGWLLQLQPGLMQPDGSRLPHTTHVTVTPVTESVVGDLGAALIAAADQVRGVAPISPESAAAVAQQLGGLGDPERARPLDSESALAALSGAGLASESGALPEQMAPILALMQALPAPVTERLLVELIARLSEPGAAG
ncbi:pyridoxal phosphate-dependent decarboxylase family protein [Salinibacterium hongtaonis]